MELLNIGFAILIAKISFCVLPGVFGAYLIALSEEEKRRKRDRFCSHYLGYSKALRYKKFARCINILAVFLIFISCGLIWFFILQGYLLR